MAELNDLSGCGTQTPSGTEVDLYYTCACELNGFPQTEKQLATSTEAGASFRLGEPFDFSTAESGKGYFRHATILVDTGGLKMMMEGEVGGQSLSSGMRFYISGTESEQAEFAENMIKTSGCLVAMLKQRDSIHQRVIGSTMVPAIVESLEMDGGEKSGDRVGTAYAIKCSRKLYYYDDATHGIDITANP